MYSRKTPLRTLTPLWTGDAEKNSAFLKETGIIGSLRWWYEGIIRGMGGYVCDPIRVEQQETTASTSPCEYDPEKDPKETLCPACRLFGTTGWRRQFRLEFTDFDSIPLFFSSSPATYQTSGNWLWRIFGAEESGGKKFGRGVKTKFIFGKKVLWGLNGNLKIIRLGPYMSQENLMNRLSFLIDFIQKWGALGAKTQNGFGQIKCDLNPNEISEGKKLIREDAKSRKNPPPDGENFSISSFFSIIFKITKIESYLNSAQIIGEPGNFDFRPFFMPCAFDIRYKSRIKNPFTKSGQDFGMRPHFKQKFGNEITNKLFGNSKARTDDQRNAGRMGVSHLYRLLEPDAYYLKVWGHVPKNIGVSLNTVAEEVGNFVLEMFPESEIDEKFQNEGNLKDE